MIYEAYGMSETILHTFNLPGNTKLGSVGRTMQSFESRIFEPDSSGQGELCIRGRHLFMGYLNMKQMIDDAVDADGWLHSGDLARADPDLYLYITGRIKEILITAGGENVAPIPIEDRIKKELPVTSYAVVVGDRKKFLSVLLTFRVELEPGTGLPTEKLAPEVREWCHSLGSDITTLPQLANSTNDDIRRTIQEGIDRANLGAVSHAQTVQKWSVVHEEFSVTGGELGPTMKLRRPFILRKYGDVIDKIYEEAVVPAKKLT
jgi:long-chain-fatty-acid--CoA ligase ACSBG